MLLLHKKYILVGKYRQAQYTASTFQNTGIEMVLDEQDVISIHETPNLSSLSPRLPG